MTVPGGRQIETDRYSIEPGKLQAVKVTIPTRYIRTREPYEKNDILIETNDPDKGLVRLAMKLQVVDVLTLTPEVINFGSVKRGSVNTREVIIANKSKDPITLTKITASPEASLKTSRQGDITLAPGKSIAVVVTYKPVAPQKRFLGLLQVETDLGYFKVISIQVRAWVENT